MIDVATRLEEAHGLERVVHEIVRIPIAGRGERDMG